MRKTHWLILTLGLIFFTFNQASAQLSSQHAVGGRFGSATGFNYRYTLAEDRAVEGILSIQSNSKSRRFRMVGLYEFHKPLAENFTWFYGFGGSLGSFKYKSETVQVTNENGQVITSRTNPKSELALSVDGIIGVEYAIPTAPLSISLDLKPYFDFIQESSIKLIDPFGLSIRYKF
ncbi:hypothetical protein [Sphingobacterium psychroaquaticum]|uniref:Uncharacterized protein n=1 Tax=Sphingobacterium psychroaquaticum TaxID=561061 RepID=A0A1X7HZJ0_9SPHI|nr:hypothetical protein [Sphingobacterium psychroaquaticum]QBQ42194.1 hypothetical protein E2P86_13970 [Sphingobacterium psychroaquaticum]SMG07322.1 hypothetical protein SAMN05660862_0271 [Sphingobacterium psychroaquaticum]